jgi:hypothetical protein
MDIIFKKGNDKNSITCKRDDGSSTWMEASAFMVAHDLAHIAVEGQLHLKAGFYGLLERGTDITDFEKKRKVTPQQLSPESIKAELLVNLILTERNDQKRLDNFNEVFNTSAARMSIPNENFSAEDLDLIQVKLTALLDQWKQLPVDDSLIIKW